MTINQGKVYDAHTVGRRKTSVARVYVSAGTGKITINKRDCKDYFAKATDRVVATRPLECLQVADKYDFNVNVRGGGTSGQAGAVRLGIARAMLSLLPESKKELRGEGLLTTDSRQVERKKAGLRGARRRFQFSKR